MRGGKRPGSGRPPGAPNKASIEREKAIKASGLVPLDYMLSVMRDDQQSPERRDDMAKAAAPYVHPRLSSAEVKSETTVNYVARMPARVKGMDEWQNQYSPSRTETNGTTTKQ